MLCLTLPTKARIWAFLSTPPPSSHDDIRTFATTCVSPSMSTLLPFAALKTSPVLSWFKFSPYMSANRDAMTVAEAPESRSHHMLVSSVMVISVKSGEITSKNDSNTAAFETVALSLSFRNVDTPILTSVTFCWIGDRRSEEEDSRERWKDSKSHTSSVQPWPKPSRPSSARWLTDCCSHPHANACCCVLLDSFASDKPRPPTPPDFSTCVRKEAGCTAGSALSGTAQQWHSNSSATAPHPRQRSNSSSPEHQDSPASQDSTTWWRRFARLASCENTWETCLHASQSQKNLPVWHFTSKHITEMSSKQSKLSSNSQVSFSNFKPVWFKNEISEINGLNINDSTAGSVPDFPDPAAPLSVLPDWFSWPDPCPDHGSLQSQAFEVSYPDQSEFQTCATSYCHWSFQYESSPNHHKSSSYHLIHLPFLTKSLSFGLTSFTLVLSFLLSFSFAFVFSFSFHPVSFHDRLFSLSFVLSSGFSILATRNNLIGTIHGHMTYLVTSIAFDFCHVSGAFLHRMLLAPTLATFSFVTTHAIYIPPSIIVVRFSHVIPLRVRFMLHFIHLLVLTHPRKLQKQPLLMFPTSRRFLVITICFTRGMMQTICLYLTRKTPKQ